MKRLFPFILGLEIAATIVFGALSYSYHFPCTPGWSLFVQEGPGMVNCPNIPVSSLIGTYLSLFYTFAFLLVMTVIVYWAKHHLEKEKQKEKKPQL